MASKRKAVGHKRREGTPAGSVGAPPAPPRREAGERPVSERIDAALAEAQRMREGITRRIEQRLAPRTAPPREAHP